MTEEQRPFTIESFYKFVKEEKLMGAKCNQCGQLLVPPKPMCPTCFSKNLSWKELPKKGKLLTYTVIHVAPKRFQHLTPYAVGIVKLEEDAQLPGIIKNVHPDKLRVGMTLAIGFEKEPPTEEWPQWPKHHFKPL
ncbi:MAG: Zn-ribbon domain-containing OB-fold protein [Candidatus Bathyarchaeia archaeon]